MIVVELRSVKILLVPTKEQRQAFYDSAYYSDLMYNTALQWNIDYYDSEGKFYSYYDMTRLLPDFKRENQEFKSVNSFVLCSAVKDLRIAFNNMKRGSGFPKFKKIGNKLSFGIPPQRLYIFENMAQIPSIGYVKCKHCHCLPKYKTGKDISTLKYHNPRIKFDGKYWFLTFGVEVGLTQDQVTDEVLGIDLGIKNTLATSSGVIKPNINNTRQVVNLKKRKKRLQRKVSKKYERNKQGNKYIKTRNIKKLERQIRLIDRRLHNFRENYNQSITNEIIHMYPARIMLEDLNIKGMLKNRHLARSIQEQQSYRIRQLLTEKALNTQAVQIGVISRNYPSSKRCSRCGNIKKDLKLSDRTYVCPVCGLVIDRDLNAAINIRDCIDYELAF